MIRWDLLLPVFLMYAAVVVVVSFGLKKVKTSLDYMLAGKQLGYKLLIPHIIGAFFGAGSTIGVASLAYMWGLGGAWYNMAEALGLWIVMALFARRLWHLGRKLNFVTVPDLLKMYYGDKFRVITGLFIGMGYMSWVAGQIVGGGRVLEQVTGFPLLPAVLISAALIAFYAGFGGLFGSVLADLIFGSATVIGALLVAPLLVQYLGGWEVLVSKLPEGYTSFFWLGETNPKWGLIGWTSIKNFLWYLLVFTPAFAIGQLNIQRIYASKSEDVAFGMSTFIASYVFLQPVFFAVIGMIAYAMNPNLPHRDLAAPWVMANVMPYYLAVVFLASLIGVVMSCAAGGLNTATASFVRDIWKYYNPNVDELKAGRIVSAIIMVLSLIFAILLPDVVKWLALGFTLMGIGLFLPTLVLFLRKGKPWKWATPSGALWSTVIGGAAAIIWFVLSRTVGGVFSEWHPIFIGLPIEIVLFFIISRATSHEIEDIEEKSPQLKTIQEIMESYGPEARKEGVGTAIFIITALFTLLVLPKLFALL